MSRRATAQEPSPTEINFDLVKAYVAGQLPPDQEPLAVEMRERIGMFEYVATVLDSPCRDISTIRVYRLVPEITNEGPPFNQRTKAPLSAIDLIPGNQFNLEFIRATHGGGKLRFILKSKMERLEFEQDIELPWPPRIYPHHKLKNPQDAKFCVMVDADNRPLMPGFISAPVPGPSAPITKEDIPAIIQGTMEAARVGNAGSEKALDASFQMMSTTFTRCLETAVGKNANADVEQLRAEFSAKLDALNATIKDQRIANLEKQIAELREDRGNVAPGPNILDAGREVARSLGVDGGLMDLAKAVSGVQDKEESFTDYLGKGLGEGLKTLFSTWGGDAIQALREYLYIRRLEAMQKQQAGSGATTANPPSPPAPGTQTPQRQTLAPPPQPPADQPENGEDMLNKVINEITSTIAYYITEMEALDGQAVAVVIKDKYRDMLGFIAQLDIFKDFNKLLEFCRQDPNLSEFAQAEEFVPFAQDFFNAFQPKKPPTSAPGPAANGAEVRQ